MSSDSPTRIRYVHCPGSNISFARNGALDAADARFLAFIDDDEVATSGWLEKLLAEQARSDADIVFGPVEAKYDNDAPAWMREARLHSTEPVWIKGEIRTGYSGNVLIDQESAAVAGLRFDPDFGKTGGEDTVFFGAAFAAGARMAFARDAGVIEAVPKSRASFRWLAQRKFRMGQTHAWMMLATRQKNRWRELSVAVAKVTYCALGALAAFPIRRVRNLLVLRLVLHSGVVVGLAMWDGNQTTVHPSKALGAVTG
jgi:succinoglycan biosynthesis protein ExoM